MISYYISKIVQAFIFPPGIIILFLFLASFNAKRFKKFFIFLSIISYLITTKVVGNFLLKPLEAPYYTQKVSPTSSLVVVLGAGPHSGAGFKRITYALMIAKKNNIPLLFNGTKSEVKDANLTFTKFDKYLSLNIKYENSQKYKKEFLIYYQDIALNTKDNAKLTKVFLQNNNLLDNPIYLVTSASHMTRAKKEFEKIGIKTIPRATDFKAVLKFCYCDFVPSYDGLERSYKALHEYAGILKNQLL